MSAFPVALGRLGLGKPAKGKAKKKARKRSRAKAVSAEYNMLLTATLCLLALGAVMVFSASSTTRILQDGGLSDSAFYLKRTLMFGAVGLVIMHLTARHGLQAVRNLTPAILGVCFFLLVAVLGDRHHRQRRQPLDRLRLPADPALGDRQGGAGPLRRRPARPQAEAGALDRRASCPSWSSSALACVADHAGARHGDDDGRHLRRRRHPDRRRRPPPRPRPDRPRDRRRSRC